MERDEERDRCSERRETAERVGYGDRKSGRRKWTEEES